ncbi:family 61 endoglucanase [Truncatella angustata]|uniref:lytic cellulose monooxygenase (C4-dehydrogenating) n=1 Tax=Truncatella angustata TaxID=152316 RepID=A0A9P8UER1_9PEZI|nr:family 61 endoglucanase [Truncatella angustata]KAH6648615.1 family 61 endoglucanase [Truncatella angustata]
MYFISIQTVALFVASVSAHGYVTQILFGDKLVDTWNPYKDPQKNVLKITRKFLDNGPVTDNAFLTDAITCNYGAKDTANNVPVNITAQVASGSKLTFYWTDWTSDHPGPIMTYLASCGGSCETFSGSTGNVWVKIHQAGYDATLDPPWASKRLPTQNSTWSVTLPSKLTPGEYLLRHEILGLQRTNTNGSLAQFYPSCNQITVTGSGTTSLPTGIALPGAYQPDDTTSIFLEYRDVSADNPYTAPGGQIWGDNGWSDQQNMVAT